MTSGFVVHGNVGQDAKYKKARRYGRFLHDVCRDFYDFVVNDT